MYEMNAVLPKISINLPSNMYSLGTPIEKNEASAIELRLQKIFQQLIELKDQLDVFKSRIKLPTNEFQPEKKSLNLEDHGKLVIYADPKRLPYSLMFFKNIWKATIDLNIDFYKHSSITKMEEDAINFQKICGSKNDCNKSLKIVIIWKEGEDVYLINPLHLNFRVTGEVNIIRFLARIGPPSTQYEHLNLCNQTDSILDICYQLNSCSRTCEQMVFLRKLNFYLKNTPYFGEDNINIADIGVWSTIKKLNLVIDKNLNELKNWYAGITLKINE